MPLSANFLLGTADAHVSLQYMADEKPTDPVGNEPSPLLVFGAALIPIIAILSWFAFG
jgi:hypothetical protein